jgi:F-type H+-transporting ATPase subunit b
MSPFLLLLAAGAEAAEKGGLPQLDASSYPSQLFWLTVTFLSLYLAMNFIFLPRLGGIIEQRRNRIADDLDQAAELKSQAEDAEKTYNQALADARAKANAIAAETKAEIDSEIAVEQKKIDQTLNERLAEAETRIATMKKSATAKVSEAAEDTTAALVEVLIDEKPDQGVLKGAIAKAAL